MKSETALNNVTRELVRILRSCTAENQPSEALLKTTESMLSRLGKAGDYEELKKRVEDLESLRELIKASGQVRQLRGI